MNRKFNVFLPVWLSDYINAFRERYGLSFSEGVRVCLCLSVICITDMMHPEYTPGISVVQICEEIKSFQKGDQDKVKEKLSEIYFEARKAIEYRRKVERV